MLFALFTAGASGVMLLGVLVGTALTRREIHVHLHVQFGDCDDDGDDGDEDDLDPPVVVVSRPASRGTDLVTRWNRRRRR
jgi:hypothetical protein